MRPSKDCLKVMTLFLVVFTLCFIPLSLFINTEEVVAETEAKGISYEGEAQGFNGPLKVEVIIIDNNIESIRVTSHSDDYDWYIKAKEQVIPSIIKSQSTNVDVVTGATFSSNGIINAVNDALSKVGE